MIVVSHIPPQYTRKTVGEHPQTTVSTFIDAKIRVETDSAHGTEGHGLVAALERFVQAVTTRQLPVNTTNIPTDGEK